MKPKKTVTMTPIGFLQTDAREIPRHWTVSDVEGAIIIDRDYVRGLTDIKAGQRIVVLFWFHKSPAFNPEFLRQTPPHRGREMGVFSICSPRRPNPIGLSVLTVRDVEEGRIRVRGIDMLDGTPILDIKPYIVDNQDSQNHSSHPDK